jgi:hypothetical protein
MHHGQEVAGSIVCCCFEVGAMTDRHAYLMAPDYRMKLRLEEIAKLIDFGNFEAVPLADALQMVDRSEIYTSLWVDTDEKSRLALMDKRAYGRRDDELTHCPTPSSMANNMLELYALMSGLPMRTFDVVSAFVHAPENRVDVFMWPPREWINPYYEAMVWHELTALYGRQTAGADFRDYFEDCTSEVAEPKMRRGVREPAVFRELDGQTVMSHHIDDGRMVGTLEKMNKLIAGLAEFLLLKVSDPIVTGCSHEYLHRTKTRKAMSFVTISDEKHLDNMFQAVGYDGDRAPGKSVLTPGTTGSRQIEEETELGPEAAAAFRSGAGSGIYYAADAEEISFAAKECARKISTPTAEADVDLRRLARYLWDKRDWVTENTLDQKVCDAYRQTRKAVLRVDVDSDWASARADRRSTSGARFTVGGFKLHHSCATQPGIQSFSSGEAELRALSRAACDAIWIQGVGHEFGMELDIQIFCDSTAAECNAKKLGPGKMKHLELAAFAVKEMIRRRMLKVEHQDGVENSADIHTKHVTNVVLEKFMPTIGRRPRRVDDIGEMMVQRRINKIEQIRKAEKTYPTEIVVTNMTDILEWGTKQLMAERGVPTEATRDVGLEQRADDDEQRF